MRRLGLALAALLTILAVCACGTPSKHAQRYGGCGPILLGRFGCAPSGGGSGVTFQAIDGGTSYFSSNFGSNAAWADSTELLGAFNKTVNIASDVTYESGTNSNIVWTLNNNSTVSAGTLRCPSNPSSSTVCAGGMHCFCSQPLSGGPGAETLGWAAMDEPDTLFTSGQSASGQWNSGNIGSCVDSPTDCIDTALKFFYNGSTTNVLGTYTRPYPLDGRPIEDGFTKGGLFEWTNAEAGQRYQYTDILSGDNYWATDDTQGMSLYYTCKIANTGIAAPAVTDCNASQGLTGAQAGLPANYGWQVLSMRHRAATASVNKPIVADVETGCPGSTYNSLAKCIDQAGVVASAWQALIAGARGILYFDYNEAGPCGDVSGGLWHDGNNSSSSLYACQINNTNANVYPADAYAAYTGQQMYQTVTDLNAEILSLNTELLSPTAVGEVSTSGDVSTMAKSVNNNTACYVFAGSGQPFNPPTSNMSVTMTLADHYSGTVTPVDGEGNALSPVTITNGTFTDTFANDTSIHIYDIPAGC